MKGGESIEDPKIIELYFLRDERAISESSIKYGKYCFAVAQNILFSPEDAEECVNDTWLRSWQSMIDSEAFIQGIKILEQ